MSIYRYDPNAQKSLLDLGTIEDVLNQLNGKVVLANSHETYTHSPLELALASGGVAVFNHLESVSSGDSTNVYFSLPSTASEGDFVIFIDTTDQGQINIYHDPSVDTSSATQLSPSPIIVGKTPSVQVSAYADVSISTTTPTVSRIIPGGSGWHAIGSTSTGLPGFGLLPGHSLAIEVENKSSNNNTVSIMVVYWEGSE